MSNILKTGNPIQVGSASSTPSGAANGTIYYNTSSNKIQMYQNGADTQVADLTSLAATSAASGIGFNNAGLIHATGTTVQQAISELDAAIGSAGVTTVGTIDSQTKSSNGAVISGSGLYMQSADATNPGLMTTSTQTIAGNKTFTGTVSASNLSGTNTGDQTITLTGNVTGSGTGSFATTIANNVVTNAMLAQMAANSVKANTTGSSANATDTTLTSSATPSSVMFRDGNANVEVNTLVENFTTTATAAGTTTLTGASQPLQQFTGTTTQTVKLPDATTLLPGWQFTILNRSTGSLTVQNSASTLLQTMSAASQATFTLANNSTAAGVWDVSYTLSATSAVTSVNGNTGAVTVNAINQLTGDVTTSAASGSQSEAATIAANAVTNSKMAQMATLTIKGNNTGGTANPSDLTVSQVNTMLGTLLAANNLSDVSSKSTSFNNISPITTLGDIIVGTAANTSSRLAGNTTTTKNFLTQTGTGSVSASPAWGTIAAGDLPTISLTGNVTGSGSSGSIATTISGSTVTNSMLSTMAANTIKANNTGSAANPTDITVSQLLSMIGTIPVANGGTNSSTALNNNRVMVSSSGAIVEAAAITANSALVSNGSGIPVASSVSATTLGYLDATSSVQTQLNGKLSLGGGTMTGSINGGGFQATNFADPTTAQMLATKNYVDNSISGLSWKTAVQAATTGSNINLSSMPGTLDGYSFVSGDRFLAKDQTTTSQNGIYIFNGTGSAATRSGDMNTWAETVGAVMLVVNGSVNAGSKWVSQTTSGGTLGTTAITFTAFSVSGTVSGSGTANYVAYWSGSSVLTSEQYLSPSRGGLGTSGSAFTGVVKASAGSFSASSIVASDLGTITDGVTLDQSGTGSTLEIKASGVGSTQIANSAVTLAKMANLAANSIIGNNTGSSATPIALSTSQVNTLLGTITALTGDVAASGPGSASSTIQANVVSNSKLAQMAANTIKANNTGGTANASDITVSQLLTMIGIIPIANGGTNSSTALNNNRVIVSSSGAIVEAAAITASRALVSSATGIPVASTVTTTTLGYLDATSSVQTQLNSKLSSVSQDTAPTLGGNLTLNGSVLEGTLLRSPAAAPTTFITENYLPNLTINASQTNTTLSSLTFAYASYEGCIIDYKIKQTTTNNVRVGRMMIGANSQGTAVSLADQFTDTSDLGITFTAAISGSNININYTSGSNGGTMNADVKLISV